MFSVYDLFFKRYLSPDDTINAVFHRHFFVALPNIFFWLVVPVLGVTYGVYHWYPDIVNSRFLGLFESYLFIMYIILIYKLLDWYGDAWILTDRGIIDVTWSLFMKKTVFIEYDDISGIETEQYTLFDKVFHIGDVTLHKHGEEQKIRRMYRPHDIVAAVESHLHEHHHDAHATQTQPDMHIYLDGFKHSAQPIPYKNGYRYAAETPPLDKRFIEEVRKKPGTIDLSHTSTDEEEPDTSSKGDHSGHHRHDSGHAHH